MKLHKTTKTAKACLLLGSITCIFTPSCAVSEKVAGERGALSGAVAGGVGGYFLGDKHGRTKGDAIKGGILGAIGGAVTGQSVGKSTSTLDIADVKKP